MSPFEKLLMQLLTSGATYDPKGAYKPYFDSNGGYQTVNSVGVGDERYEYVVPSVKRGQPIQDPMAELRDSGEYFARFPRGLIGRALGNYTGKLVHQWQAENNKPTAR